MRSGSESKLMGEIRLKDIYIYIYMMYFFEDRYNEIWYLNIRETIYDSRNEVEEN